MMKNISVDQARNETKRAGFKLIRDYLAEHFEVSPERIDEWCARRGVDKMNYAQLKELREKLEKRNLLIFLD